jgi:serine phosphatase RsbU (regulator of sigma subunit)
MMVDVRAHQVVIASAGHLPPLLITARDSTYLESKVGLPVGVQDDATYETNTVSVPARATILAFTDGLVERRGENLDLGLARLRELASAEDADLAELLARIARRLREAPSEDDTAIVGLRWSA